MSFLRFCCAALCLCAIGFQSFGQQRDVRITEEFKNIPLENVLNHINEVYGQNISFYDHQVRGYKVTANIKSKTVSETLTRMLEETHLYFMEINDGDFLLLSKKNGSYKIHLKGQILDAENLDGVSSAYIRSIKFPRQGIYADSLGRFDFELSFHEKDTLLIGQLNYQPIYVPMSVLNVEDRQKIRIKLKPTLRSIETVQIEDREKKDGPAPPTPPSVRMPNTPGNFEFDPTKLGYLLGLGESDALRTLQTLPGVSSVAESAGNLNIRGSNVDENLVLLDGIPIYQSDHLLGLVGAINTRAVQNVSLYSSGYDATFGGRIGGIVDIEGKPNKTQLDNSTYAAGINILNYSGFAEKPFGNKNGSFMISARSSFSGFIETRPFQKLVEERVRDGLIFKDFQGREESGAQIKPQYSFYDINGKLNWLAGESDKLTVSFFKSADNLDYSYRESDPLTQIKTNYLLNKNSIGAGLSWKHYWKKGSSQTQLIYSGLNNENSYRREVSLQDGDFSNFQVFQNSLSDLSLKHTTNWEYEDHDLTAGLLVQQVGVSTLDQIIFSDTVTLRNIARKNRLIVPTVFFQDEFTYEDVLTIKAGVRYGYHNTLNQHMPEPRLSLSYRPDDHWNLKFSAGRYYQYLRQQANINLIDIPDNVWTISGIDSLSNLSANHIQTGFAYQKGVWMFGMDGYLKQSQGLTTNDIVYNPEFLGFIPDTADIFFDGNANTAGLDVFLKFQEEHYVGWVSYTLSKTRMQFDEFNEGNSFLANHDRRHSLKFVNILKWDNIEFSAIFLWMKGLPITEITRVNLIPNSGGLLFPTFSNQVNGTNLPDYHRLDVTASWKLIDRETFKSKMGVSVFNLYNRANVRDLVPAAPSGNGNPANTSFLQSRDLLGISPNLFINLEF
ncbi:MAG: TonB-dependent receptor [Bacteroidota bacterium]